MVKLDLTATHAERLKSFVLRGMGWSTATVGVAHIALVEECPGNRGCCMKEGPCSM